VHSTERFLNASVAWGLASRPWKLAIQQCRGSYGDSSDSVTILKFRTVFSDTPMILQPVLRLNWFNLFKETFCRVLHLLKWMISVNSWHQHYKCLGRSGVRMFSLVFSGEVRRSRWRGSLHCYRSSSNIMHLWSVACPGILFGGVQQIQLRKERTGIWGR